MSKVGQMKEASRMRFEIRVRIEGRLKGGKGEETYTRAQRSIDKGFVVTKNCPQFDDVKSCQASQRLQFHAQVSKPKTSKNVRKLLQNPENVHSLDISLICRHIVV
jgi:hypothetical protein